MSESMEVDSDTVQIEKKKKTEPTLCDIVILDDDDVVECDFIDLVKTGLTANTKCINYACKSGTNMLEPPGFCLSYYRIKNKVKKRQQVCFECYEEAIEHYDALATAAKSNRPLMALQVAFRNDVVEIDDSDSDSEDENVAIDSSTVKLFESEFDETVSDVLRKYNFNDQVRESCQILAKETETIGDSFKEVKTMFESIRSESDQMIFELSNIMRSENMDLPPLNIVDRRAPVRRQPYKHTAPKVTPPPKPVALNSPQAGLLKNALQKPGISNVPIIQSPAKGATPPVIRPIAAANMSAASTSVASTSVVPMPREANPDSIVGLTGDIVIIPADLPPLGIIEKPQLKIGEMYYANRSEMIGAWIKAQLTDIVLSGSKKDGQVFTQSLFEISIENKQKAVQKKYVSGKEIAYSTLPGVQLDVGTRVIAVFRETTPTGEIKKNKKDSYYPGIVAEPLQPANKYRYLIFFDDGYAQYVSHTNVHLIYEANKNVWEDVNVNSRAFVKKYLENYETRAMVRFLKDQTVRTEYNGKWWVTTVINVDCSLVQVFFDDISRIEWIYRGSTRFSPMFEQEQAAANRQQKQRFTRKPNMSGPYVEFTRSDGSAASGVLAGGNTETQQQQQQQQQQRSVARKSTSKPQVVNNNITSNMNPFLPADLEAPATKIVYYTPRRQKPKTNNYETHNCTSICRDYLYCQLNRMKGYSPLAKPLLCGFYRLLYKVKHKKIVVYRAPCGRTLRNMAEVHRYLRLTKSDLTVDLFDFNVFVRCLAEFMVEAKSIILKDLSEGKEECPITVVNYVDSKSLDFCNYSTKRQPMEGVMLNLESDFLVGCDCTDDCSDRSKCSCWQLTLESLKYMDKDTDPESVGYQFRRLPEPIFSGIFECNQRCKCAATCLNRVVQNPMQHKLQVFKTDSRGWGIRCLNDIPQGSFICIYAGSLLTEDIANLDGKSYGDEYLAELDFIETAERAKEDYEEDPYHDELSKGEKTPEPSSEEDAAEEEENDVDSMRERQEDFDFVPSMFIPKDPQLKEETGYRSRLRQRKSSAKQSQEKKTEKAEKADKIEKAKAKAPPPPVEDDDTVMISDDEDYVPREPSSFIPKDEPVDEDRRKYRSVREMFGSEENVYIMDAKSTGNIGRFLNHSCSPNIFVQNVFVDTHDPRFPWVAFFTMSYVRAGTELTWNYNYDIGSVPDKVLYCYCGSSECKGRLL